MTDSTADLPSSVPRRELLILAAISVGTVLFMGVIAEAGTRVWWPEQPRNPCIIGVDRPRPGCTATLKNAEGPWTTMAYNACGYRSAQPCGPKPAGARRVVVMGKSVAEGMYVPYEEHFATRIEGALTAGCGFPVESQSLGSLGVFADRQTKLLPEVLGLEPDVVVMALHPFEMNDFADRISAADAVDAAAAAAAPATRRATPGESQLGLLTRVRLLSRESRALLVAQHFMLMNDDFLLRAYQLRQEDDVLRTPPSAAFKRRYTRLEEMVRAVATTLGEHGVPLVLLPVPNRIEAALVSDRVTLPDVDPWAFSRELEEIGARTGVRVAAVFAAFAARPHAERLFYAVDGHPSGEANAVVADVLTRTLKAVPAFSGCAVPD